MALSKEEFFANHEQMGMALTYDDVRLTTAPSDHDQSEVDTTSLFSRNIELKVPIVSAAMDTVTEAPMAIAMAKMGGLGVIHAGLSIERQREEVRRVKLHLNGLIENPVVVGWDYTLAEILADKDKRHWDFSTFPVVDEEQRLKGILTQNDFEFASDSSVSAGLAMTPIEEIVSATSGTTVQEAYEIMRSKKKKTLPLIDETGRMDGMYILSDVKRIIEGNPNQYNLDANGQLLVAAAVPTNPQATERVQAMEKYLDVAVIDTAQGDLKYARQTLTLLKEEFKGIDVVIGNISSSESAELLANLGADGIKVGQGPGSICTTRPETGIGTPQVTAVYECMKAVRGKGVPVCADGGLREPGDISIAIAAGAHSVMMGSMLAGTEEAPGELVYSKDGSVSKVYRGMGSPGALRDSQASRDRYGSPGMEDPLPEGIESIISYKGSVLPVMARYIKALRKSLAYVGAADIEAHRSKTGFTRITNAGLAESHTHDVQAI